VTITFEIVVDCTDPTALGRFWAAALGYVESPVPQGYDNWEQYDSEHGVEPNAGWECVDPEGRKPNLFFQRVPEGKSVKNRWHLDLKVDNVADEVKRLTALGAHTLATREQWTVMCDPEGNEFCVAAAD